VEQIIESNQNIANYHS